MLSVESLIRYGAFWQKCIPFESNYLKFKQRDSSPVERFESIESSGWDLVAEYAFMTASRLLSQSEALAAASNKIENLRKKAGELDASCSISPADRILAEALAEQIRYDFELYFELDSVSWLPVVPGFGGLLPSEADALSGSCLIEVKNVDRAFHVRDVRQVLLYATALNGCGVPIDSFYLVNSRKGFKLKTSLHNACRAMGGRSWISVRSEIEDLLISLNSWFVREH